MYVNKTKLIFPNLTLISPDKCHLSLPFSRSLWLRKTWLGQAETCAVPEKDLRTRAVVSSANIQPPFYFPISSGTKCRGTCFDGRWSLRVCFDVKTCRVVNSAAHLQSTVFLRVKVKQLFLEFNFLFNVIRILSCIWTIYYSMQQIAHSIINNDCDLQVYVFRPQHNHHREVLYNGVYLICDTVYCICISLCITFQMKTL